MLCVIDAEWQKRRYRTGLETLVVYAVTDEYQILEYLNIMKELIRSNHKDANPMLQDRFINHIVEGEFTEMKKRFGLNKFNKRNSTMATYTEIRDLFNDSALLNRVEVAIIWL